MIHFVEFAQHAQSPRFKPQHHIDQAQWRTPVIPVRRQWRQEHQFKGILDYVVRWKPAWATLGRASER